MKKIIAWLCILETAILTVCPASAAGSEEKAYNWYCCHRDDGVQPECAAEMQFIQKYNGYYLDCNHSDPLAEEKVIYLTFDAGYENGNIEKILDVLKDENVPGAFFILENLAKRNPALVRRMAAEGHLVCNHTALHKDMTKIHEFTEFKAELERLSNFCKQELSVEVARYYRPPEGRFSEANLQFAAELGYKTIFWSFGYVDWDNAHQMDSAEALEKILSGVHNGEILLLHPTSATNAAILQPLIRELRQRGFQFRSLDALTSESGG